MCVALSAPLHAALSLLAIPCRLCASTVGGWAHVFLQLGDGRVLDPSADQFNEHTPESLPAVYLGPPTLIHDDAVPWAGGEGWHELMVELLRLCPNFTPSEVGQHVNLVLRTLPPDLCVFASPSNP